MKTLYSRVGKSIKNIETGEIKNYDSLNKAKRASREMQQAKGGLGCGSLVKIK